MPQRKSSRKKTSTKRKRFPIMRPRNNTVLIRRTVVANVTQPGAGNDIAGNYYFQCSQIPNSSELGSVFKSFKLLSIDMKWIPKITVNESNNVSSANMYVAFNQDNVNTGVPNSTTIREQNTCKMKTFFKTWKHRFYPVIKNQVGATGITTYYTNMPCYKTFVSTNSLALQYYGVDWFVPDPGLTSGVSLGKFEITYNIACKDPR